MTTLKFRGLWDGCGTISLNLVLRGVWEKVPPSKGKKTSTSKMVSGVMSNPSLSFWEPNVAFLKVGGHFFSPFWAFIVIVSHTKDLLVWHGDWSGMIQAIKNIFIVYFLIDKIFTFSEVHHDVFQLCDIWASHEIWNNNDWTNGSCIAI